MQEAYLEYEPITGTVIGVHWSKPEENWIEIDQELAVSFMDGSKKLHLHRVIMNTSGALVVDFIKDRPAPPVFGESLPDDISNSIKLKINKSSVTVTVLHDVGCSIGLFVTMKNDPSWLVDSANITRISNETGKKVVNIKIPNASDYSYHIGAIDEI